MVKCEKSLSIKMCGGWTEAAEKKNKVVQRYVVYLSNIALNMNLV